MKTENLNYSFSLYFPQQNNNGKGLYFARQRLSKLLVDDFGGLTETTAKGKWKSPADIIEDKIYILSVSSTRQIKIDKFLKFCFDNTDQCCFFYILNGKSHVIWR